MTEISLPDFGVAGDMPELPGSVFPGRLTMLMSRLGDIGADAIVIYADREHAGNLAWLTGFDPRFEEALLIATPGRDPVLLTGPENQGVAGACGLDLDVRLYPPMGLMGQDRSATPDLDGLLADAGIRSGQSVAVCGWKYFSEQEASTPQAWIEIPAYLVDALRSGVGEQGRIFNAGHLFMDPARGLRTVNTIDELARCEFAACHTSESVKNLIRSTRPGMREFEAARSLQPIGIPLSCHTMFSTGSRAWHGLLSPSSKIIEKGDAVTTAYGVQGALNCRAGWLVDDAADLPENIRDYLQVLVGPYFEAIAEWLETVEVGVEGGRLDAIIRQRIGSSFFGINLNPGHLIHYEEWIHTPITRGGKTRLRSGMAIQVDVIPATGGPYFTTNIEDGIAILDQPGRSAFADNYPGAMARIEARRAFMADELGIHLKPDVLPLSNIAGWLPPFWLSPDRAMTMN